VCVANSVTALGKRQHPSVVGSGLEPVDFFGVLAVATADVETSRLAPAHAVRVAGEVIAERRPQRFGLDGELDRQRGNSLSHGPTISCVSQHEHQLGPKKRTEWMDF